MSMSPVSDDDSTFKKDSITVAFMVEQLRGPVGLEVEKVNEADPEEKKVVESNLHRPGLALAGYVELFTYQRVQILGNTETRLLVDDGTNGDAVAGDTVYTIQFTYPAGSARNLIGKFSVSGFDTEATGFVDHAFTLAHDTTINVIFGAINTSDGLIMAPIAT